MKVRHTQNEAYLTEYSDIDKKANTERDSLCVSSNEVNR